MPSSQSISTTATTILSDHSRYPNISFNGSRPSFRLRNGGHLDDEAYSSDVHVLSSLSAPHSFDYDNTHFNLGTALSKPLTFTPLPFKDRIGLRRKAILSSNTETTIHKASHLQQRSLTVQTTEVCDEMNAIADEAPGSPPGLTASKSSKASTNPSSSSNSVEGILSDVSNFEDIGLDEIPTPVPRPPKQYNGLEITGRAAPRAVMTTITTTQPTSIAKSVPNGSSMGSTRDLTGPTARSPRPVHAFAPHQPAYGHPGPMRKFSRNASTPSLAIRAMSNYNRSRSPSPQSSPPMPRLSPHSKFLGPPARSPPPSMPVRRGSWQPSGKTAKEREAECDDEDGDDLPDEASLWNVPISPRPAEERTMTLSPAPSPRISPGGSPERSSPLRTSVGADGVQYTAPKSAPLPTSRQTLPANFHSTSPPPPHKPVRGVSIGTPTYQRSKSWNIALSELSHEAKLLTQSLEQHETEQAARRNSNGTYGDSAPPLPPLENLEKLSRTKSESSVQLPPLRTNNIMIDPLPPSKEKERVLSRTRPSWLPPKSKQEERRHLAEYQKMMALSQAAERKRAAKASETQCAKDATKATLLRLWEEHVIPNWGEIVRDPRTRELWWKGIPPKCRGEAWSKALGNDLALTEQSFHKALSRARQLETSHHHRREHTWFEAIKRDTAHTFPDLQIFQPGAPLHANLLDVLKAYAVYRSDVGYSHGTHLLAAFLLLNLPTAPAAFIALANLLNRPLPLAFLTGDRVGENKAYSLVLSSLKRKYPRLHEHLFGSTSSSMAKQGVTVDENTPPTPTSQSLPSSPGLTLPNSDPLSKPSLRFQPHELLEPLLRTLFLAPGNGLGLDTTARIWDVMVFDGDSTIIRAAVATLGALESKLYGSSEDVLSVLGWGGMLGGVGVEEEEFVALMRRAGKELVRRKGAAGVVKGKD